MLDAGCSKIVDPRQSATFDLRFVFGATVRSSRRWRQSPTAETKMSQLGFDWYDPGRLHPS